MSGPGCYPEVPMIVPLGRSPPSSRGTQDVRLLAVSLGWYGLMSYRLSCGTDRGTVCLAVGT